MALPQAALDDWLMELFPGKTLEELDAIDFPRLVRAQAAKRIGRVEVVRALQMKGQATPSTRDWQAIVQHDRLMRRFDPDEDDA